MKIFILSSFLFLGLHVMAQNTDVKSEKPKKDLTIGIQFGLNNTFRKLYAPTNEYYLKNYRDSLESSNSFKSFGIVLIKPLVKNFSLQSGFLYAPQGYSSFQKIDESFTIEDKNKFNFIRIPLNIRYNYEFKRFSAFAQAGISPNFLISQKNFRKTVNGDQTTFTEVDRTPEYSSINVQYQVGLGLSAKVWKELSVFTQIEFSKSFTSVLQVGINEKLNSKALNFGVTWDY